MTCPSRLFSSVEESGEIKSTVNVIQIPYQSEWVLPGVLIRELQIYIITRQFFKYQREY